MKKRHGCLTAILVVIAVFVILVALGSNEESETPEQSSASASSASISEVKPSLTPEEIKEAASTADRMIYLSMKSAQKYFDNLDSKLDEGTYTDLELYTYCEEIEEYTRKFSDHLGSVDDEAAKDYKIAVNNAIGNIRLIATDTKKYLEDEQIDRLRSVQEGIQLMPAYEAKVIEARVAYLKQAGFTDEEITERLAEE